MPGLYDVDNELCVVMLKRLERKGIDALGPLTYYLVEQVYLMREEIFQEEIANDPDQKPALHRPRSAESERFVQGVIAGYLACKHYDMDRITRVASILKAFYAADEILEAINTIEMESPADNPWQQAIAYSELGNVEAALAEFTRYESSVKDPLELSKISYYRIPWLIKMDCPELIVKYGEDAKRGDLYLQSICESTVEIFCNPDKPLDDEALKSMEEILFVDIDGWLHVKGQAHGYRCLLMPDTEAYCDYSLQPLKSETVKKVWQRLQEKLASDESGEVIKKVTQKFKELILTKNSND